MNTQVNISQLQLFIIYISTAFSTGIISVPSTLGSVAREDMWLSTILCGLVMGFSLWCALTLSQYYPKVTAIEYNFVLLGPILGKVLNIYYLLNLVILGASMLRLFSGTLKMFLFDLTPQWIIIYVLLGAAAYAGQYGIAPLIRLQEFFIFVISPFFILLFLLGILKVEAKNLQPFLAGGIMPVLKGIAPTWHVYSGPELITGLLFPLVTQKKHAIKTGLTSVAVLIVVYTVIIIIIQGILGLEEILAVKYPSVIAYREVDIPDTFVERIDGYLLLFHIGLYFLSLANLMYFSAFGCSRLMKLEYNRPFIILLVPVFYFIAMLPQSTEQLDLFFRIANYIGISWGVFIMPLLLLVAKLRNQGGCS